MLFQARIEVKRPSKIVLQMWRVVTLSLASATCLALGVGGAEWAVKVDKIDCTFSHPLPLLQGLPLSSLERY